MESQQILGEIFRLFSSTSVNNPFEVIIIIISICISLSLLSSSSSHASGKSFMINAFDENHELKQNISYFNYSFLMFLRCLAFICVLVQFKKLKKVHSKFILTISIIVTVVSSFLFNSVLINWFNFQAPNTYLLSIDILIYTLVVIDLKKCNQIINNALEMNCFKEAKTNMVQNFAQYASTSCLDTLFLILLFSLGNLSDSNEIKNFALFSTILLASNFFIFITIYPAFLSLIVQFKRKTVRQLAAGGSENHSINDSRQQQDNQNHFASSLTNPVIVYVKVLMTLFLLLIHLKLKFFNENELNTQTHINNTKKQSLPEPLTRDKDDEATIFYTECCLLVTLIVYIVSKFAKLEDTHTKKLIRANPTSTQTLNSPVADVQIKSLNLVSCSTQTEEQTTQIVDDTQLIVNRVPRTKDELMSAIKEKPNLQLDDWLDEEVIELVNDKKIPIYRLESYYKNTIRAVNVRRKIISNRLKNVNTFFNLPFEGYDYVKVTGSCCENVVGYVPIPLGLAGPLLIDGKYYHIPMATTEGTLVASTNRGCNALSSSSGVSTKVLSDGMTRGPVIEFTSAMKAAEVKEWLDEEENFMTIKRAFDSTSRFAKLETVKCCVVGKYLYVRFAAKTGDAMGMNMLSKGSERALIELKKYFPEASIMSVSGNYCTDKKSSAINWIEGRGKSVVCEAIVKGKDVRNILKTSVEALIDLNLTKNLVGSAMAGSIGGFNAHAANIVAAIFIACGQDPAQVVESSNCLTWMELQGEDLYISCTMPSLEVGTVGGGTFLDAQSSCLKMLGVFGPNDKNPGENASNLARIIAATVLAGELSLMSALASGHLVNSHMKYNRSTVALNNQANIQNAHNLL